MLKDEKGFILPIVLLTVVAFSILAIGLLPNITAQHRFVSFDQNRINAQYAAEAGAKTAIRVIQTSLDSINGLLTVSNIANFDKNKYTESFIKDKSSYTVEYHPDNMNPDLTKQINIKSTGFCNGRQYTVNVIFGLSNSNYPVAADGVVDLFKGAEYSHKDGTGALQSWVVSPAVTDPNNPANNKPATASPPGTGNYQVLFKDQQYGEAFKLAYNAACKNFPNDKSGKGYGIYYGATGSPDNLTSYVFQYDPGAFEGNNGGAFFVKKVKQANSIPNFIGNLEWDDNKLVKKAVPAGYKKQGSKMVWVDAQPEVRGGYYNTSYPEGDNFVTPCYVPFQPNEGSGEPGQEGTVKISLNKLKSYMEQATGKTFNINDNHKISIEVKDDGGVKRHIISCDGIPILNFVDKTTTCPIDFSKTTYTGLRVWNADVGFYNNPHEMYGQKGKSAIIWTK